MKQPGREDIDALLYDFGGVIIEVDFDRVFARWSELSGLPMEQVKARFRHGEEYNAHERGRLPAHEFYGWVRRAIGFELTDAQIAEGWMRVLGPEIAPTVALIHRLEGRIPQYLFSNTNVEHHDVWAPRHAKALAPIARAFISCHIGLRKPEPEAFAHVAREIGVAPGRILFFDDTAPNIEGARQAGLQAVHVRSPEDVANAVRPWL
jgi:FMN phosphatase YigB (HAD superfamily)